MPSKNPAQRLADIRENIEAVNQFVAGLTLNDFSGDRKTVYAVTRALARNHIRGSTPTAR